MQENQQDTRNLPAPEQSFFLFGPRGVGKTTWLKKQFANEFRIDLLNQRDYLELVKNPNLLEAKTAQLPPNAWVILDEIQKIPSLLDEVHRLMEDRKLRFALTGSSARKLKRSGVNLLAGRAVTRQMFPLTSKEWPKSFDLNQALEWGGLPLAILREDPKDFLESYFQTYIREEIREEGLVRNIEPFIRFLEVAGNLNGQVLNIESIARETGTKRVTLDNWFSILEDTLVAMRLPAWRPGFKVREQTHPKFYWFDCGVARAAAGLLYQNLDRSWLGWALENWILHELRAYISYHRTGSRLFYYALPSDVDIDLIVELSKGTKSSPAEIMGIEIKLSEKWKREWEQPLRSLKKQKNLKVKRMIGLYTGREKLTFDDFTVFPVSEFLKELHEGLIFLKPPQFEIIGKL